MNSMDQVALKRALEALRSGVPNHDAVRALGCHQPKVDVLFKRQLAELGGLDQPGGLLISGGFGTGKSHVLEYLEDVALSQNCVCSRIVISKETPLFDIGKVFRAAVTQAVVPGRTGHAIQEIAHLLRPDSERYAEFYRWVTGPQSTLPPLFAATLFLHERLNNDPEMVEEVTHFWSGGRISAGDVKKGMKKLGASGMFDVRPVPVRDVGPHLFAFCSRLIRAAGFRGWVLLVDEVELIGRYSPLQRGRAYAEVPRLMGGLGDLTGLASVLAITDDFSLAVLQEKSDRDVIGGKLRSKGTTEFVELAKRAEVGMRVIETQAVPLVPPDRAVLAATAERLRELHGRAYGWTPPESAPVEFTLQRSMRSHIRRWIGEWDLRRLYPSADIDIQEVAVATSYDEDRDLEAESEQAD